MTKAKTNDAPDVCVLGAGAFGCALAEAFAAAGRRVIVWARDPEICAEINLQHTNSKYASGFKLNNSINASSDASLCMKTSRYIVYALPSTEFRNFFSHHKPILDSLDRLPPYIIDASKGIETGSLRFHHEIIKEIFGEFWAGSQFLNLSGPSFAKEMLQGVPTLVTIASRNAAACKDIQENLGHSRFRLLSSDDIIGSELGGALKNVLAIAVGAAEGMGLGMNSRAAMITRGLSEIARLGLALGAKSESFLGLSCLGDLVLTCTGELSRNRRFGFLIGQGKSPEAAKLEVGSTIEGYSAAVPCYEFGEKLRLDLPITKEVYAVLYKKKPIELALETLLSRPQREEWRLPANLL